MTAWLDDGDVLWELAHTRPFWAVALPLGCILFSFFGWRWLP